MEKENSISFTLTGRRALFTDPISRMGGEKFTYQVPTYQALKGVLESIYWKPTLVWIVDRVRIMKPIRSESQAVRPIDYGGGNTLSIYTYLADVEYQVQAHFVWNENRPDLAGDRNENKHYYIAKRALEKGGRRDIFLGTRECQGYVEPCNFGNGEGAFDGYDEFPLGLMFHGFTYPDEAVRQEEKNKLTARFFHPEMKKGIIVFPAPEECSIRRILTDRKPKEFSLEKGECNPCREVRWMSWLNDLYLTYEACKSEAGVVKEGQPLLLPVAHLTQNAQLEVVLDEEGHFSRAYGVDKQDAVTVIPVTEDSGTRAGSAIYPHPLADKLEYIAGDYGDFVAGSKPEKFANYIAGLAAWAQSEYSLHQVKIVYQYLSKGMLMHDLLENGVFSYENDNIVADKQQGIALVDWFVRFAVEIPGQPESRLYCDPQVFESYIQFYLSSQENRELCYVTGEIVPCSEKHPAKIRNTADKAKLISSNNASGVLTFKGRFTESRQVASVSYEISQKAHSALRWLIAKQAFLKLKMGEQVFVVWSLEKPEMSNPFEQLFWEMEEQAYTDEAYSDWVRKSIWGSEEAPGDSDSVMVMVVEAATTGRLSIPFYQKYEAKQFIRNITKWKTETSWLNKFPKDNTLVPWSPSFVEIVELVAGEKNEKFNKSVRERLLPCIIEGRKLPYDMAMSAMQKVVNPSHYKEYWKWNKAVTITCALLRKWQMERGNGKEQKMSLDTESKDRSYIFGQLLATAEMLERSVLTMGNSNNKEVLRNTAAEKYFVRFQRYPVETWTTIRNQLNSYMMKLKNAGKPFYINKINELTNKLDLTQKDKLEPTFLQGYSSQMIEYRNYSKKSESDENEA